jgi:hypothetical protein
MVSSAQNRSRDVRSVNRNASRCSNIFTQLLLCAMERIQVSSTNLRSVGYEPSTMTLEIEFNGGRLYQYFGVPTEVFGSLMSASSHGQFFHRFIKDQYHCRRLR